MYCVTGKVLIMVFLLFSYCIVFFVLSFLFPLLRRIWWPGIVRENNRERRERVKSGKCIIVIIVLAALAPNSVAFPVLFRNLTLFLQNRLSPLSAPTYVFDPYKTVILQWHVTCNSMIEFTWLPENGGRNGQSRRGQTSPWYSHHPVQGDVIQHPPPLPLRPTWKADRSDPPPTFSTNLSPIFHFFK